MFFKVQVFQGPDFQRPGPGSGPSIQALRPESRIWVQGPGPGFRSGYSEVINKIA